MIDDCDPCDVFDTKTRAARKEHRCDECFRTIAVGERYDYTFFAKHGEDAGSNKCCRHCAAARVWLDMHCGGWVTGGLSEDLWEHWCDGYREDRLGLLIAGIRRKWLSIGGDGLLPVPDVRLPRRMAGEVREDLIIEGKDCEAIRAET